MNDDDFFDSIYESWIDTINSIPLHQVRTTGTRTHTTHTTRATHTVHTTRNSLGSLRNTHTAPDVNIYDAYDINNSIASTVHNIRRYLELQNISTQRVRNSPWAYIENIFNMISNPESILDIDINIELDNINNMEDVRVTLDAELFDKLYTVNIDNSNIKEYETCMCNICMETYKIDEKLKKLPCNHFFHEECIKAWLCQEKTSCPVCRKDVRESF